MFLPDNIITRRVLIEKINNNDRLLFDFDKKNWKLDLQGEAAIDSLIRVSEQNMLYGEFTKDGEMESSTISLANVSHAIKNVEFKNNKLYGDILFLNTTNGFEAKVLNCLKKLKPYIRAVGYYTTEHTVVTDVITIDLKLNNI
jgi:hypothetical protein